MRRRSVSPVTTFRVAVLLLLVLISSTAASKRKAKRTHSSPTHAEPEAAAVKGGSAYETNEYAKYEGDSKACRYDDAPWSDCDPFELIRYRVIHLVHGGHQCQESKNITKHCIPDELTPGARWLISEHRRCIAELKRIKGMIADLAKYIATLSGKGKNIMEAYLSLNRHLDELRTQIDQLANENSHHKATLAAVRSQLEEWKAKARDLQTELEDMRTKFHDLQVEHQETGVKLQECWATDRRCNSENARMRQRIGEMEGRNAELRRRLADAQKYKEQLRETTTTIGKLEYKVEKLRDKAEVVADNVADCKLGLIGAKFRDEAEARNYKDTHVDLSMEMWILHNKSSTPLPIPPVQYPETTTYASYSPPVYKGTCLLTYYGYTNETCWYDTKDDRHDYGKVDRMLGSEHKQNLVEAHWKYFTIETGSPSECDRAAQLHYEFLLHRCKPKHYLPVLSVFRPTTVAAMSGPLKELTSHIYPKPNLPQPGGHNRCWVTFLGPHGHCEAGAKEFPLYNSDDTTDGYEKHGSSTSKSRCLARKASWESFCKSPVLVTYLPEAISTGWTDDEIAHDSHGGNMLEDERKLTNKINPESLDPNHVSRPTVEEPEEKSADYEDTPEFRKSLNMKGTEKDDILVGLRKRLGLPPLGSPQQQQNPLPGSNPNVKWHRPGAEVVKGAAVAPSQQPHPDYMPSPSYKAPQVGQHAPKSPSFHDNTKASMAGSAGYGGMGLHHPLSLG